jgi:hypothetical protein
MNDIEFSLKPSATEWEIVSLILASVLFNQPRTWSGLLRPRLVFPPAIEELALVT